MKTGGGPTVQEAAVIVFPFKEADGMDGTSFIKCGFLQSPHVSHLGESHFGKLSVHQIRRRLVQFLSHFTPAFLKSVKKRALCFLQNPKESWLAVKPACTLVDDASLGPWLPLSGSGCPRLPVSGRGWAGMQLASCAQSFVL